MHVLNHAYYFGEILRVPAQADRWTSEPRLSIDPWPCWEKELLYSVAFWLWCYSIVGVLKANGSPVPLLRGKINEVAGMVGKKHVA